MRLGLSARYFPDVLLRLEAESKRWAITADICADIAARADAHDVPVLFVLLPGANQVDKNMSRRYARAFGIDWERVDLSQASSLLGAEFGDRGLTVVDATAVLRFAHESGVTDLYGRIDHHFGRNGHRVVAEFLKPIVSEMLKG